MAFDFTATIVTGKLVRLPAVVVHQVGVVPQDAEEVMDVVCELQRIVHVTP